MGLIFRKEFTDYTVLFVLLTALCSSDKVSSQVFIVDEEVTDVALIFYSAALLQNNLVHVLGQILQNPEAGTRLSWEQIAKLSWLQENLISRRLSTLSMVPAAQRLLLMPTVIPPEEQLSLILHEACLNYWDDSIPIHSFKVSSVLTALPTALTTVNVFHLVSTARCINAASFLDVVFKRLKQGTVFLSSPLLYGILHTYPFACILPDLQEALDYVSKEIIYKANTLNDIYVRIPLQQDDLKALLLDVLKFLVSNQSPLSQKAKLRIQIIIPYLTTETCKYMYTYGLSMKENYNLLFSALKDSDYPADVRDVKYTLVAALESKELDLEKYLVDFDPGLFGSNRLSLLLGFLQKLSISLPNAHPASAYVSTLLPYVKFKYIASKGGHYIPRTSLDIAVLLNAFNTIGELSEARTELYKALTKDIQWESMLHNFPYYEYTDPRSLLISMVQSILSHNRAYKLCHKLIMQYFLEKANNIPQGCSSSIFNNKQNETYGFAIISKPIDILLEGPITNGSLPSMVVTYKPRNTSIRTATNYAKPNGNTITKYSLSTTTTPIGKQRETQQVHKIKCTVDGTVDVKINSVKDICHYLEAEKNEVFPIHVNIECTDSNQKKLYLSSTKHPECNTVIHLPSVAKPKFTTAEKPFKLTQHATMYTLKADPFTVKEKETTEIPSVSTIIGEETTTIPSDNVSVESQTEESVSTLEPTTVATPVFSRLSSTSVDPKRKPKDNLEQKSTAAKVTDTVTLSTDQTTYIPKEPTLEGRDSLSTATLKEVGFTMSKSVVTEDETVLPTNVVQTEEPIPEVTIPFQAETAQNYESFTAIPNILHTMKATKANEFETTYTGSVISTAAITSKQEQETKAEHTVEPTVPEVSNTERFTQAIMSKSSKTETQTVPIATILLPDTMKPLKPTQAVYITEMPEWKVETKEASIPNEQMFTSVLPAANISTTAALQTAMPTVLSTNIFINKTSNFIECTKLPNIIYILIKLNISQESINIIENVILTPEVHRALKYFTFAETELPRKLLIRLFSFLKYYADLNTMVISTIDEVLYKINADSSIINEPLKIINICTDAAGLIYIMLPSATPKTQEFSWTTAYQSVYSTTAKAVVQTVVEEDTTHTEEISTPIPEITAGMKVLTVTSKKQLGLPLTKDYETVTTKYVLQPQKISSYVTEETPVSPTLGQVSFPTEQLDKTIKIIECIKMPNFTSLLTALPHVSRDSISIIINNILKPEFLVPLKQFRFTETEAPVILLTRFLNFIKYYTEPSPKVIRAIDDVLLDININTYLVNLTLKFTEICTTEEGKMETLVPTASSFETIKGHTFTSGYKVHKTVKVGEHTETLVSGEDISTSTTQLTETFTKHLQESTLPMIPDREIPVNKTSSITECMKLPNVTYLLTRLHVPQEFSFLIENIILTPGALLALRHFKFVENESFRILLIRLLNFVKYYAELNIMDIRTIDEVLSKINLVSTLKNEPLKMMDICMDTAGGVQILPSVTSLKLQGLSLTTDSATVNIYTDKEVMQTVTLEGIPQSEYITSISETTPEILDEISTTTSSETEELTLTTSYKDLDMTTDKEIQTLGEEATLQIEETSTSAPERSLTTTSSESPDLFMVTDHKVMHVTAKEEVVQTVTEKVVLQTEHISTSIPELVYPAIEDTMIHTEEMSLSMPETTPGIVVEMSLSSKTPPDLSLTTGYKAVNITEKEIVHTVTEDAILHTKKASSFIPEISAINVDEISLGSTKSATLALTTDSATVNTYTDKEVMQTVIPKPIPQSEYISTSISKTTPDIWGEITTTSIEPQELTLSTGYKGLHAITDKESQTLAKEITPHIKKSSTTEPESSLTTSSSESPEFSMITDYKVMKVTATDKVAQTVTEKVVSQTEHISTSKPEVVYPITDGTMIHTVEMSLSMPETTPGIVVEMPPSSKEQLELSLITGYKAVNITDKEVIHTVTEDVKTHTKKTSTFIPEITAINVDEISPHTTKTPKSALTIDSATDKEIIQTVPLEATLQSEYIPTSISETTPDIWEEILTTTSIEPQELTLTTGYKDFDVTTDKQIQTLVEEAIPQIKETSTSEPESSLTTTSSKSSDISIMPDYKVMHMTDKEVLLETVTEKPLLQTEHISTSVPKVVYTVTEDTMMHPEQMSLSMPETTPGIVVEMSPSSETPLEVSLTTGYKTVNIITDKEVVQTVTEDAMTHTKKTPTFTAEISAINVDEISPHSTKSPTHALTTDSAAVNIYTDKEVMQKVATPQSEYFSTSISETAADIWEEILTTTSVEPQELNLTSGYKDFDVTTDKEIQTLAEEAIPQIKETSTSEPESSLTTTSSKSSDISMIPDYKVMHMTDKEVLLETVTEKPLLQTEHISTSVPKVVYTVTEDTMMHPEQMSLSMPETTPGIVVEMSPPSKKPLVVSLTSYTDVKMITDEEAVHTVTEDAMIHTKKASTVIPEITAINVGEISPYSTKTPKSALTTHSATDKEVIQTVAMEATPQSEYISTSITETIPGILEKKSPTTSSETEELTLTTSYKDLDVTTDKEIQTLGEEATLQIEETSTSAPERSLTTTSSESPDLFMVTDHKVMHVTAKEEVVQTVTEKVVLQTEHISTSIPELVYPAIEDTMIHTEEMSLSMPETTPGIVVEMSLSSKTPPDLSLTTGYKAVNITEKEIVHTVTEDAILHTKKASSFIPEISAINVDEISLGSTKSATLALTTDSATVNTYTDKEVMQTVIPKPIPQSEYISTSISKTTPDIWEEITITSIEPQELTLSTGYNGLHAITDKESQMLAKEITPHIKKSSTTEPESSLTTSSSESPEFSMTTDYKVMKVTATDKVAQTVTEKVVSQTEHISTSEPEVVYPITDGTMIHTVEMSLSMPETTPGIVVEMSLSSKEPQELSLTTGYKTVNITDKEVIHTVTEDGKTHTKKLSTFIPEITAINVDEISPHTTKTPKSALTVDSATEYIYTDKEVIQTVPLEATPRSEYIPTSTSETIPDIWEEILTTTSIEPQELTLTTGYKDFDVTTDKQIQTLVEEAIPQIKETSTSEPESSLTTTSSKSSDISIMPDYKVMHMTDKEVLLETVTEKPLLQTEHISTSVPKVVYPVTEDTLMHTGEMSLSMPETSPGIVVEMSPPSKKPLVVSLTSYTDVKMITDEEVVHSVTEDAMMHTRRKSTFTPEITTKNVGEISPHSTKTPKSALTTDSVTENIYTDKEVMQTAMEVASQSEHISTSITETTPGILEKMSTTTSIELQELTLTTGYKDREMTTDKENQTLGEEATPSTKEASTSKPERSFTTSSSKSPGFSIMPDYKVMHVTAKEVVVQTVTEKAVSQIEHIFTSIPEVVYPVTEDTMIHTEEISLPMPETTPRIVVEMSPSSKKPLEVSLTTGYKTVNIITDKEVVQTVTEDAMTHTKKTPTFTPEISAINVDEISPHSTKSPTHALTTDSAAVNIYTDKEVMQTVPLEATPQNEYIPISISEATADIWDETTTTSSIEPQELTFTTGYKDLDMTTDKAIQTLGEEATPQMKETSTSELERSLTTSSSKSPEFSMMPDYKVMQTVTEKGVSQTEHISTSVPEITTKTTNKLSPTSTIPLEFSLTSSYKSMNMVTDKDALYPLTEVVMTHTEKSSPSIPETATRITGEMLLTTTKPLEFSLTPIYQVVDVLTDKEGIHTEMENAVTQTLEMPSMPQKSSTKSVTATSTKSLQLSSTSYEVANKETTSQSEQISNSVIEFADTSPSLAPTSLSTVTESINKTTNIVDCITLPNITSLITIIPPASREALSLFQKHLLQPEFLEPLKQFKFMEKEAPMQLLPRFLKFIKFYSQPTPSVLSAIDDLLLHISNNIISVPLNIMKICINKKGTVETIWPVKSPLEPTTAFDIDITDHFNASPTSKMQTSFNFTGQYQMDTTNSPTFHIHTDIVTNTQSSPTSEADTIVETTTNQLSTEWDENQILGVDSKLTTQQHKFSTSIEGLKITETLINTVVYPETEKITNANIKLVDHLVTSHGFQTASTAAEIKAITGSVPKYQSTMETAELDILASIATTKPEGKTMGTVILKQSSLESQNLLDSATPKASISSADDTINPNKETKIPNVDITATNSLRLSKTTYEPLAVETPIIEMYSTKLPSITEITKTDRTSAITEMSKEESEQTWHAHVTEVTTEPISVTEIPHITQAATKRKPLEEIESTEKHYTKEVFKEMGTDLRATSKGMTKIPIFAMGSTRKIEDGGWTMEITSAHSEIMSTGMEATQELTVTATQPTKTEITKLPTEKTVMKDHINENTNTMDHFSTSTSTKVTPYKREEHWTNAPSTISEAVIPKTSSLKLSNLIHQLSTVSPTEAIINSSKIICITENYTLQTNIPQMNETNITLECIKIPDISLLLKVNEHISRDLLNAFSRILCRTNVLSLLKSFEIPESSTAANAMRRFLIFLKYNVEPDAQTTKVINEIMKNIRYDSLSSSGVVTNEICFSPPVLALPSTYFPKYSKAQTLPSEVSSEMTDILHKDTRATNEQTTQTVTSPLRTLNAIDDVEHAKTRDDRTSTNMLLNSKYEEFTVPTTVASTNVKEMKTIALTVSKESKEKVTLPHTTKWYAVEFKETALKSASTAKLTEPSMLTTEQMLTPNIDYETSENINTEVTTATDSSFSPSFASLVSTSKISTLSLPQVASSSLPIQSDDAEFHTPTLPNLTNIIHKEERKAYTIYPYVIEQPISASWYCDGNIIVPKECPHGNMTHMLIIDVISLFEALDSQVPNRSLKHLIGAVTTPETESELKILDWTMYNNKHTFLKDVFTFLIINSTYNDDIKDELISALHHIRPNSDDELPTFKFVCIPGVHLSVHKINEYKDMSELKITTKEHCNASNSYNVVISIPIAPLFKCINLRAPRPVTATIMAVLSRDGISFLLSHFNALHYKSNGELLHALLTHLSHTPSLEDNVLQSIRILLSFIEFDGCGALAPTLTTECINIDEIEDMGFSTLEISTTEHEQTVMPEAFTAAKTTKHILDLHAEECTENKTHLFVIDVPALFQAVKPEIGSNLHKNIINILEKPDMQMKLKELPWERYVTKAEFISDILSYILSKTTQKELSHAIEKIVLNIQYDGPGAEPPMFKFVCVDFGKLYHNEMEEQAPYLIIPTASECNNGSKAVLLINIDSLLQAVKQEAPPLVKAIAIALFQRKDFYTKISELKFENNTTSGMALKSILIHLIAKGELESPSLQPVKELLKYIQLDGSGARQLEIRKECQSVHFSPSWDDLISNEEEKIMIIPFQCDDNLTLSGRFTVDIPSLFLGINTPTVIKFVDQITEYFKTFKGQQLLAKFKWEVYETRSQMLKDLLSLVSTLSEDDNIHVATQELLPLVDTEDSKSLPLVLKFECDTNVADTVEKGNTYCENNSTSLWVVNITSLFQAFNNDTPEMPKKLLSSYLSRLDIYKDLLGFSVHDYNTKSELLWKILTYIMLQNTLNYKLYRAAAELVTHINWDGPEMENMDASIVCNITSEVLHLDLSDKNINRSQEKSIIKINGQCHENGTMDIVDVDATSLVKILPKFIRNKIYNISELLNSSKIKNKLKEFKWDIHHKTKCELLKEILTMLFKEIPLEENVLNQIDKYIHKMNDIIETAVPLLSYRCINSRENYSHIAANITQDKQFHKITGGLAIMQPTYGKCPNENNNADIPIIVVNIANLFKALKPNTSVSAKATIISHMTHTQFYKQITGFNLMAYKTRGEQLQKLLAFLASTSNDTVLLKAIDTLLRNILLDGPGQLPSVYRIVCNTKLNQLMGTTRTGKSSSEITDSLGAETENVSYIFSALEPCIEGSSGMTYKINIPSLFYALKSEAPQESLAILACFIAKPSFSIQLKTFNAIQYKTQGSLLHAILSFISKKADTPSEVVQAIEDILPFVHSVALGKKIPKITLNCSLPNLQETAYEKQALEVFPEQGVNIVNKDGLPCNYITSNSDIVKGRTVYIFDIPTMINILEVADNEKKLITTFLKSPAFQQHLQMLNFRFSTNNAKNLEHLLLLLQESINLQQNEIEIVQNMISKVREIQEAHIPPVLVMKCTTDTTLKESPWEATNQTCFLPWQYSHTGIAYDLQWDSLLEAMSPQTPSKLLRKLERFLNITHKKIHLEGFNIFQYKTRGALLKDLLVFLALKPSLNLEYKKLISSLVPYVQLHGMGSFAPTVISDCPKSDTEYITESTDSATEVLYTTTLLDPCFSDPNSILINQFDATSLFSTLDKETPSHSVSIINNYLQDDDIQEKLHGFDVKKYETKNDLLQGLLAYVWSDQNSSEIEKSAAKTLLPHIMFNVTEEPPILKTACYIPKKFYIRYVDDIPKSLTLVYPTEKVCLHNLAHIPGIIVHRITISTLFKALHPKLHVKKYLAIANFLSKPYAYKYVQGINIERYQTRGELLRAVLTFLRFSQKYMEDGMKDALVKMLPLIQLDGLGNLPVDKYTECSLLLEENKFSSLQLHDVLKSIEQTSLNAESHDAYLTISDFLTSPGFNLTHYISWLDEKRTLTNGELLKIILLQIYDKNPNMGKAAMLLMPHIEEHKGIGEKRAKIETYRYKEIITPYEINFLELLKVIKPEAPKRAVSYVFNLFGKQHIYKDLRNFNPDEYETQGELLVGILKFLEVKYATNSTIGTHVKDLIPFVDMTNIGALPPIVKTIYITFNTSVSVFRLDLAMLYKLFPKEKLTHEQQQAMDEIFKFLSTKGYKLPELFQGLSSRFPFQIQIKLILEKLKLMAEEHLKVYANDMLQILEQNMPQFSSQDELIPEMDWIEILHAIPDSDVPSEVIAGKKELYRFFLSASFKTIIKNYRVNLSVSRGKFLKDLLSYLRSKPDVSCIKVLKRAIAYVFMFIREVGAGAMSVQDDIILPEQQEEARSARNRIKELLYQVLGVIEQEGAFEILQTLQRLFDSTTKLNLVTTYLGYDVLEEFPPKERLITILRRIYHNFIMFLDQDTISAIDMVFISLGETKQQTSEILHFLPVDMETLLKTVLGPDTPPLVVAASDFIRSNINLNTIPLGKAFQDTVPSVLNLDVRKRLTVILRILWRVFSKSDDAKIHQSIRTVYEYLLPNKLGNELSTQEHHMAIIAALKGLIRSNSPKKVRKAMNNVIEQLVNQQNVYDKVLAYLVTQNLSPKHLIAKALRRFREHQLKMNPKLWSSVSVIFNYLHIPEHESLEEETDGNINIVDELTYLVDEAGIEVAPAKRILMKYIIDKKPKLHKLFRAQHTLLQYPQAEKMALILNRLLKIYGETLEPEIFSAASIILNHLDVLVNEVDINDININEIFNLVINESAPKNVIKAKTVIQEMLNNATVLYQVLQTVIIQKDFTPEHQLVTILRQFYNIFKQQLQKTTLQFLTTLFDYLKVSLDSSVEDQFVGNFTFKPIFKHIFPEKEVPEYVTQAVKTILGLLSSEQVDVRQLLYGVHLWKLSVVSQVSIILYRLTKIPYINKEVRDSIDILLEGLGIDLDELASEDIDESYTPDKLFNEAIGHRSTLPEVQEAKGILMKFLSSGSSKVKNVYRGIDFKNIPQPKDRLVAVLKNMYNKRNTFGEKMTEALDVISNFLQVDLGKQKIDPYTFDFDGILEQVVPIAAPLSVRQARNLFLTAVKNRPGTFKKILDHVNVTDYETENDIVSKILNATQHYNRPLSKHLRRATNLILDYLHGVSITEETNSSNDYNSKEDAESEEDGIGFRMFEDEFKPKRKWKIKKKLRRYD